MENRERLSWPEGSRGFSAHHSSSQAHTQTRKIKLPGVGRQEGLGIPLLLWFNVKESQFPSLPGREAFGFLFLFFSLPASEVLQNNSLALQLVLTCLLAHVRQAAFQECCHKGFSPLGSWVLCGSKVAKCPLPCSRQPGTRGPLTRHSNSRWAASGDPPTPTVIHAASPVPSVHYQELSRYKSHIQVPICDCHIKQPCQTLTSYPASLR